jgi:hypothetical protein
MVSDKISVRKLVVHDGHREPALCGCEQKEVAHPILIRHLSFKNGSDGSV